MYVAIDIETGGLDFDTSLLQIACVKWDRGAIMNCSYIDMIIRPEGPLLLEPYAARMNTKLIDIIAEGKDNRLIGKSEGFEVLRSWLGDEKYFAVGKNAAAFDLPFLKHHGFEYDFHHRVLDVGSMYATKSGIPSLSMILKDLGPCPVNIGEPHDALYDARVTLWAAQCMFNRNVALDER